MLNCFDTVDYVDRIKQHGYQNTTLWIMWIRIKQHGYQNMEYKAEPVWYSALHGYAATYLIACHCLSSLVLNILRVVSVTIHSESEFESWTILWLNTFLRTSSLL